MSAMAASGEHWRALARLVRAEVRTYIRLALVLTVGASLPLAGPLLVRRVVDLAASGSASTADVVGPATAYLVIAIASQFLAVFVTWLATVTAWNTANRLRLELAEHVLSLDLEFHRTHSPGELIQRIDGDITSVSDFLSKIVAKAVSALLLVLGMVVVLTVLNWRLGLGFAVYALIAGWIAGRTRDRAVGETVTEMAAHAKMYGGIEERLTAGEDLRSNRAGPHVMWRFIQDNTEVLAASMRSEKAFIAFWARVQLTLIVGVAIALGGSAWFLQAGAISLGTTLLLVQYALMLRRPLEDLVDDFDVIQKASGAMVRVGELQATRSALADNGSASPPPGALSVECVGLGFHYGDGDPILTKVNLSIPAGRTVGLVGRTGGGKTTLARLVLRLADATEGQLLLGGVPIQDLPLGELRSRVAMIPQEVHLLAGSVRENVTLFDASVSDDRVVDALTRAGLAKLVAGGIHRRLGGDELSLSAGEEQLLSMARIWLRDPDLIVLDEATARIDPKTEERLHDALAELTQGRTALIVAHRLSTLHSVDEIVVIDGGRILEHGNRASLEADPNSEYRRMLDLGLEAQR